MEHDEALRERGIGEFEGRSYAWIAEHRPDAHAARLADPWHWRPAGGENFEDLRIRTGPLLARLRSHPAERILIVSHSALARPLLGQLLDLDERAMLDVRVPNDIAYRVCLGGGGARVTRIGDEGERPGLLTGALAESLLYDPASPPVPPGAGQQS